MKFLIILDKDSIAGSLYAKGNNDGITTGGHPLLDCTELVTDNPYYIFATRSLYQEGKSHQTLYLPHGSVALIHRYDESDPHPLGFYA